MPNAILRTLLALFLAASLHAEKHALLIGISHYTPGQNVPNLEGPGPDVDALSAALIRDFAFKPANVHVLRDAQASRAGILAALDDLIAHVQPGDYVLLYYSGHGTSPQDEAAKGWNFDVADTGAMIPADFRRGTPQEIVSRLIIGRRDLRPRLMKLDGKATVFGILDTCYSANLMKSAKPTRPSRSVPLGQLVAGATRSMEDDIHSDAARAQSVAAPHPSDYPYKTVGWISAALGSQSAADIGSAELSRNPNATRDGKPHGALTNTLLIGLDGAADANHDGVVTHEELYEYALEQSLTWSHQPAWSANESDRGIATMSVLGGRRTPLAPPTVASAKGDLRVQLEGGAGVLSAQLARVAHVAVVSDQADLIVRASGADYMIYQSGGVPINENPLSAADAVTRIAVEPDLRNLLTAATPTQSAHLQLSLRMAGERVQQGLFYAGQDVDLYLESDAQTWPLIVDVDVTGMVTVLYPRPPEEKSGADPVPARSPANPGTNLGTNTASCPCGIEYIRALAFDHRPVGYDNWRGVEFAATDPKLKQLLGLAAQSAGQSTLRIITNSKD
jgi:hypothetical protein